MKNRNFHIYKSHGGVETFSRKKLFNSLKRSGLPSKQCQIITDKVAGEIGEGTKTKEIYRKTLRLVKERSTIAAIHYSLKKAIFELGPTGHHFESFVGRYFKEIGYSTRTCQTIPGRLVKHEVDVVASKNSKRVFVECKFHNRLGIKNDVKIALYIKARRDDLMEGPNAKDLETFYIASNTAFSLDAITYANGSGIKLLGLNAPAERPFIEEIKSMNLYPITSLKRLSKLTRDVLLSNDVILAKEIPRHLDLLLRLGMDETEINALLAELEQLKRHKI